MGCHSCWKEAGTDRLLPGSLGVEKTTPTALFL